ncbi:MAG TPA: cytochrome c biogenesis protein CcdA, partial [Candidatus Acidoferrales bacterium]|nr:cytochrome c biogenesis protein CcdA [Candidatus Acidoferrales bacterium]
MRDLLVGGTLLTSFLAGAVALFAPCCISVMLPAYFASTFRRRRALVSMTFVFALGVGTIILPIALGAVGVSRLISGHHTPVFLVGAVLMVAMGLATLLGWKLPLPMPGMRARADTGPAAVCALGAFSGVASACCAPVLAGVIALSGVASSFLVALAVGVAYVFGMVLPLFAIAVLWDRRDWGASSLLRGRTLRIAGRELSVSTVASGLILLA